MDFYGKRAFWNGFPRCKGINADTLSVSQRKQKT